MSSSPESPQQGSPKSEGAFGHVRRREYSEQSYGTKNTNLVARAHLLRIVGLSGYAIVPGAALGFLLMRRYPGGWLWIPLMGIGFPLLVILAGLGITAMGGRAASTLHNPSGGSTPFKRQHSGAEALRIRGEFAAAIEAYERAGREYPEDARPWIEIARIHRDSLDDPSAAAEALRRALAHSGIDPGQRFLATRELCELYTHRLGEPRRALPVLARIAETQAGTREGEWAARELAEVKAMVFEGEDR